jgi:hypothetical protein
VKKIVISVDGKIVDRYDLGNEHHVAVFEIPDHVREDARCAQVKAVKSALGPGVMVLGMPAGARFEIVEVAPPPVDEAAATPQTEG